MKKIKKVLLSPGVSVVSFVLAIGLLAFAGIGTSRAALQYFSNDFASRMRMDNIGVSLLENGDPVSHRNYVSQRTKDAEGNDALDGYWDANVPGTLLSGMLEENETLVLNKDYKEELRVMNTGKANVSLQGETNSQPINEFVRVNIYRYWVKDNKKLTELSPNLIDLKLQGVSLDDPTVSTYGNWIKDTGASTDERIVLYYNQLLEAGDPSTPFADTISIDDSIAVKVSKEETIDQKTGWTTIKTTYDYDGVQFCLDVTVDAVQEHNAEAAIPSAWGRSVRISGKSLSLS